MILLRGCAAHNYLAGKVNTPRLNLATDHRSKKHSSVEGLAIWKHACKENSSWKEHALSQLLAYEKRELLDFEKPVPYRM